MFEAADSSYTDVQQGRAAHAKVITDANASVASWRVATFADLKTSSACLILEHCIVQHPNHVFVVTSQKLLELVLQ